MAYICLNPLAIHKFHLMSSLISLLGGLRIRQYLNNVVRTKSSLYTIDTRLLVEDHLKPVVQLGDIRGVFKDKFWILSPEEWFILMKGNDSKFATWFYEMDNTKSVDQEVQQILGYDEVDNPLENNNTSDDVIKKIVTFAEDVFPSTEEQTEENSFILGKYKLIYDEGSNSITVWEDKMLIIRMKEEFIQELMELYEVISLKLELLQKYQFYAVYIFSRYTNHFIKIKNKIPTEEDIETLNLENIPKIAYLKIDYTMLDIHLCRALHAEVRKWAIQKILKSAEIIRSTHSRSWIESNHLYL